MAEIVYHNQGIRDQPLDHKLENIIRQAADAAGVDTVFVFSGGQPSEGPGRTGSHRHDNGMAGDIRLYSNGQPINFLTPEGEAIFSQFAQNAAALGATGIGAGKGYMDQKGVPGLAIHVGFGSKTTWGAGGHTKTTPGWLVAATKAGWGNPMAPGAAAGVITKNSSREAVQRLQQSLTKAGFSPGAADGKFGLDTVRAVKSFQAANGLTVDGRPGPNTMGALSRFGAAITPNAAAAHASALLQNQFSGNLPRPRPEVSVSPQLAGAGRTPAGTVLPAAQKVSPTPIRTVSIVSGPMAVDRTLKLAPNQNYLPSPEVARAMSNAAAQKVSAAPYNMVRPALAPSSLPASSQFGVLHPPNPTVGRATPNQVRTVPVSAPKGPFVDQTLAMATPLAQATNFVRPSLPVSPLPGAPRPVAALPTVAPPRPVTSTATKPGGGLLGGLLNSLPVQRAQIGGTAGPQGFWNAFNMGPGTNYGPNVGQASLAAARQFAAAKPAQQLVRIVVPGGVGGGGAVGRIGSVVNTSPSATRGNTDPYGHEYGTSSYGVGPRGY
jgi:peptidoglycan hydrolase-like protein with peptidoglycan-binding domain